MSPFIFVFVALLAVGAIVALIIGIHILHSLLLPKMGCGLKTWFLATITTAAPGISVIVTLILYHSVLIPTWSVPAILLPIFALCLSVPLLPFKRTQ